ncbi:MAG TPA: CBS domain-containing protein [Longimicrobiales bacterium]|nr:CBS domain-containing protein [Longimicrobiales bacterium]
MTMLLTELLPADHILVPVEASGFRSAVQQIVQRLAGLGAIRDVTAVERALATVRGRDVVSIGPEVALPHFRTDAVDRLVLGLAISRAPLDTTGTTLESPPRIVALVLAPPEAATRYLQTVAALARVFRDQEVVAQIAAARTPEDVLRLPALGETKVQPELRVRDVMAHRTEGVAPAASVRDALDIMLRHGWRSLPVLDDRGAVLGILTEWDVMRALLLEVPSAESSAGHPKPERTVLVRDAMTRSVLCVSEDLPLEEAAHMMLNKNVEQFPVVAEGVMTGILTRADIIRKLFGR